MSILVERLSARPGWCLLLAVALAPAVLFPHVPASRISFNVNLDRLDKGQEHADNELKVMATASPEQERKKVAVDALHDDMSLQQPHADSTSKATSTKDGENLQDGRAKLQGRVNRSVADGKDSHRKVDPITPATFSNHSPVGLFGFNWNASLIQARIFSKIVPTEEDGEELPVSTLAMFFAAVSILLFLVGYCGCSYCGFSKAPQRNVQKHKGRVVFEWDQCSAMANMYIRPPPGLDKKDIEVTIEPASLKVGRKGKAPFLEESFYDEVDVGRCSWKLRSNGELQIYLQKFQSGEWPNLLAMEVYVKPAKGSRPLEAASSSSSCD